MAKKQGALPSDGPVIAQYTPSSNYQGLTMGIVYVSGMVALIMAVVVVGDFSPGALAALGFSAAVFARSLYQYLWGAVVRLVLTPGSLTWYSNRGRGRIPLEHVVRIRRGGKMGSDAAYIDLYGRAPLRMMGVSRAMNFAAAVTQEAPRVVNELDPSRPTGGFWIEL